MQHIGLPHHATVFIGAAVQHCLRLARSSFIRRSAARVRTSYETQVLGFDVGRGRHSRFQLPPPIAPRRIRAQLCYSHTLRGLLGLASADVPERVFLLR
jgi:hypothetical protein